MEVKLFAFAVLILLSVASLTDVSLGLRSQGRKTRTRTRADRTRKQDGHKLSIKTTPLSGSTIGMTVGERDVVIECQVFSESGVQQATTWYIVDESKSAQSATLVRNKGNFAVTGDQVKSTMGVVSSYKDHLTIKEVSAELDQKVVYCGGSNLRSTRLDINAAKFYLRIYSRPKYKSIVAVQATEGDDITIPLKVKAYPMPEPEKCTLTLKGGELPEDAVYKPDSVSFTAISHKAAGKYILTSENKIGKGSITFEVDVKSADDHGPMSLEQDTHPDHETTPPTVEGKDLEVHRQAGSSEKNVSDTEPGAAWTDQESVLSESEKQQTTSAEEPQHEVPTAADVDHQNSAHSPGAMTDKETMTAPGDEEQEHKMIDASLKPTPVKETPNIMPAPVERESADTVTSIPDHSISDDSISDKKDSVQTKSTPTTDETDQEQDTEPTVAETIPPTAQDEDDKMHGQALSTEQSDSETEPDFESATNQETVSSETEEQDLIALLKPAPVKQSPPTVPEGPPDWVEPVTTAERDSVPSEAVEEECRNVYTWNSISGILTISMFLVGTTIVSVVAVLLKHHVELYLHTEKGE